MFGSIELTSPDFVWLQTENAKTVTSMNFFHFKIKSKIRHHQRSNLRANRPIPFLQMKSRWFVMICTCRLFLWSETGIDEAILSGRGSRATSLWCFWQMKIPDLSQAGTSWKRLVYLDYASGLLLSSSTGCQRLEPRRAGPHLQRSRRYYGLSYSNGASEAWWFLREWFWWKSMTPNWLIMLNG